MAIGRIFEYELFLITADDDANAPENSMRGLRGKLYTQTV